MRGLIVVVLFLSLWQFGQPRVCDADDGVPTIDVVREGVQKWIDSLATLQVEWQYPYDELYFKKHPEWAKDPQFGDKFYAKWKFKWSDEGLMTFERTAIENSKVAHHAGGGYGTETTWYGFSQRNAKKPEAYSLVWASPRFAEQPLRANEAIIGLSGLWHSDTGQWVGQRLRTEPWTVEAVESWESSKCVKLVLDTDTHRESIWLDLENSYIPRRFLSSRKYNEVAGWTQPTEWTAKSLGSYSGFVFPSYGTDQLIPNRPPSVWTVTSCQRNAKIPRSTFELPKQPGLQIVDHSNWDSYQLDKSGKRPPVEKAQPLALANPAQTSTSLKSTLASQPVSHLPRLLLLIGALALGVGLFRYVRGG